MVRLRRLLTWSVGAAALALSFPASAGAQAVTQPSQWYTVANGIGQSYGLAPDGQGGLLSYAYTGWYPGSAPGSLLDFSASQLAQAAAGVPVAPLPAPLTTTVASPSEWDAGIAVATDGTIYFTSSSDATIWELAPGSATATALPVASPPWSYLTGLVLSPNGQGLYVADQGTGTLYQVNLSTDAVTTVLTTDEGYGDLQQIAFDASGNLFVVDQRDDQILEITASTLQTLSAPVTIGAGAQVVVDWGNDGSGGLAGLAFDAAGNLYSGDYSSGDGVAIVEVSAAQLAQVEATGVPATFSNGELVDVADSSTPAVNGPQPLAVVNNVLYVGNFDGQSVVALALATTTRAQDVSVVRTGGTLSATWQGGTAPYRCVLLQGFHDPTGFAVGTATTSCSFSGLSLYAAFGVEVISGYGTPTPLTSEAFAPAPGLTCARGTATRHYTSPGSRCPRGWHATD